MDKSFTLSIASDDLPALKAAAESPAVIQQQLDKATQDSTTPDKTTEDNKPA